MRIRDELTQKIVDIAKTSEMSNQEDEKMKKKRDKLIQGGNKPLNVVEIDDSPVKPKKQTTARKSSRASTDISIRLDGEAYEEAASGEIILSKPKTHALIPASQIMATGFSFRDNLRRKLVDTLIEKVKNPYLVHGLKKNFTGREVLVDLALRIENQMFRAFKHGKAYNDKTRSIIYNLTDEKNIDPLMTLLRQKISPEDFVMVDLRKLASEKMKKYREDAEKRGLWNKRTDWDCELVKQ